MTGVPDAYPPPVATPTPRASAKSRIHLKVEKALHGSGPTTTVVYPTTGDAVVREIARMQRAATEDNVALDYANALVEASRGIEGPSDRYAHLEAVGGAHDGGTQRSGLFPSVSRRQRQIARHRP